MKKKEYIRKTERRSWSEKVSACGCLIKADKVRKRVNLGERMGVRISVMKRKKEDVK